tara:strand:- start:338 stop:562 length:225 start_codon:yes stop_codon:yes gene_type:complete
MNEYLSLGKMVLFFFILLGIQTITRIKSMTDGMDMARMMMHVRNNMTKEDVNDVDKVFEKMKDAIRDTDKKNWN